ncbi:MAG: pyridoxamine 5'-phosphate oxidase family protein [Firmicutes bacterium]|jgi:nitroimidazol reductase NimA-like FMN-containing flavoprotein (pyridoxamine 5'-phosphate oxidase superfamily)|nr:pyridoxamine 5'-phosphate oxidase family protein [Bacillota bacterium]NBI62271.1 pyridoxamine 5'-phosphate oxidase family protein [Clostridiales bacterium]
MDQEMRRKEKAMSKEETLEVLEQAEYGVLATISGDDTPYAVPMNFVYVGDVIYFHCALEGHRLENIKGNNSVCLNVVDSVVLMPEKFNTQYRSVTAFGTISIVENEEEKRKGIKAIADKLSPEFPKEGMEYINSAFHNMHVLRMDVTKMTGKATRG